MTSSVNEILYLNRDTSCGTARLKHIILSLEWRCIGVLTNTACQPCCSWPCSPLYYYIHIYLISISSRIENSNAGYVLHMQHMDNLLELEDCYLSSMPLVNARNQSCTIDDTIRRGLAICIKQIKKAESYN
jgi:hypothetical protein